jgi:hypothetical protein
MLHAPDYRTAPHRRPVNRQGTFVGCLTKAASKCQREPTFSYSALQPGMQLRLPCGSARELVTMPPLTLSHFLLQGNMQQSKHAPGIRRGIDVLLVRHWPNGKLRNLIKVQYLYYHSSPLLASTPSCSPSPIVVPSQAKIALQKNDHRP